MSEAATSRSVARIAPEGDNRIMRNAQACLSFLEKGIDQVAVIVPDLEEAMRKYWEWLGVGPWRVYTYGKPLVKRMAYRGKPSVYKMRIALSFIGPLNIELIEMLEGDTIYADFVAEHGFGLHHFGIFVKDMEQALVEARAAGLSVVQEGSGFGLDGSGHYAYLDTEGLIGVTIELIELPKRRAAPDKIYPPEDAEERDKS